MGRPVQPADLPALKSGLLAGVHGLSGCRIEHHAAEVVGELLTLEARFTFYDGVAARKRWVDVDTPAGKVPMPVPPGMPPSPPPRMDAVPALGQHTAAILAELSYTGADIDRLRAEKVV